MIKLFITAIETKDNGQAVTIFEDFKVNYDTQFDLDSDIDLNSLISEEITKVEKERVKQGEPI